jgi:hypothetical protein
MKNTALQDLINELEYPLVNNIKLTEQEKQTIKSIIELAKNRLPMEKQDLIDAHYEGQKECSNEFAMESDAILYYNETFKQ